MTFYFFRAGCGSRCGRQCWWSLIWGLKLNLKTITRTVTDDVLLSLMTFYLFRAGQDEVLVAEDNAGGP